MPKDTEKTIVIFRKFRDGDVIALFPCLPGTSELTTCMSYQHVGQHGAASISLVRTLDVPQESEIIDLYRELEGLGYNLVRAWELKPEFANQRRRALGLPTY